MKALAGREDLVFSPPELGCVLWLPGLPGGSSKIYDRSPYGNSDTITGATWVRLPSELWCLDFDGSDDKVDCGNPTSLQLTGPISFGAWFAPAIANRRNMGKAVYDTDHWKGYFLYFDADYYPRVYWGDAATADSLAGNTAVTADTWHFLIAVLDGVHPFLYLDTNVVAEKITSQAIADPATNFDLGVQVGSYYGGKLALPRLYNRALSALEIQNSFNREKHLFGVW